MEATELRIGNYVDWDHLDVPSEITLMDFAMIYDEDIVLDKCQGIPLTEEWLLRFGFEIMDIKGSKVIDVAGWYSEWKDNEIDFAYAEEIRKLKYVHQLQNLVHALTGEELTIKE